MPFPPGGLIERREILPGRPWSVIPVRVVDDGDVLALLLA